MKFAIALLLCLSAFANSWSEPVITLDGMVENGVFVPGPHRFAVGYGIIEGPRAVNEPSPCHVFDEPRRCAWVKVWIVPAAETLEQTAANVGRSGAAGSGRPLVAGFFQLCKSAGCREDDKVAWIYQAARMASGIGQ